MEKLFVTLFEKSIHLFFRVILDNAIMPKETLGPNSISKSMNSNAMLLKSLFVLCPYSACFWFGGGYINQKMLVFSLNRDA